MARSGALWRIANQRKASALTEKGIEVVAQLACEAVPNPHSRAYLLKEKAAHALMLDGSKRTRSLRADGTQNCPGIFLADAEQAQ
jgi:hypothetical protein